MPNYHLAVPTIITGVFFWDFRHVVRRSRQQLGRVRAAILQARIAGRYQHIAARAPSRRLWIPNGRSNLGRPASKLASWFYLQHHVLCQSYYRRRELFPDPPV